METSEVSRFFPRCAFCVDTPDQLAKLPPRLQQTHAELLARCARGRESYPQLIHIQQGRGVQDSITDGQDSTPDGQASTNNYKEEVQKKKDKEP